LHPTARSVVAAIAGRFEAHRPFHLDVRLLLVGRAVADLAVTGRRLAGVVDTWKKADSRIV
jgi:hypothetical protein